MSLESVVPETLSVSVAATDSFSGGILHCIGDVRGIDQNEDPQLLLTQWRTTWESMLYGYRRFVAATVIQNFARRWLDPWDHNACDPAADIVSICVAHDRPECPWCTDDEDAFWRFA